jgi:hypothetical protein
MGKSNVTMLHAWNGNDLASVGRIPPVRNRPLSARIRRLLVYV